MKKRIIIPILITLILLTGFITFRVFETTFAEITIDWFAFLAGIFLVLESGYKLIKIKTSFFPDQLLRTFRLIIGTCVFTIHLLQFMR
ncbi:MAG: hypothetical protein ABH869_04425 [Candidatus Omnitrophota bacterium]